MTDISHVEYKEVCHQGNWCIMKIVPVSSSIIIEPTRPKKKYSIRKRDKHRAPLKGIAFSGDKDHTTTLERKQKIAKILESIGNH